jgi:protein TonB
MALALALHCGTALYIASLPYEAPTPRGQHTGKPLATVQVVLLDKDEEQPKIVQKTEPLPEVSVEIEPAPEVEELPDIEKLEIVKLPPKPKVAAPKVRKEMVARKAPKPPEPKPTATAPVATTKAITAPSNDAPGEAATTAAKAKPGGTTAGGDPNQGTTAGTESRSQSGAASGSNRGEDIDLAGLRRKYMRQVSKRVHRKYRYPRAAERARITGRVLVEITIDSEGNIVNSRVKVSSGHPRLDKAALKSVASLGRLPAPPRALQWKSKRVTIPFDYTLRS